MSVSAQPKLLLTIDRRGELKKVYAAAKVKADHLVEQATDILKPLEIAKSDIEQLVQAKISQLETK